MPAVHHVAVGLAVTIIGRVRIVEYFNIGLLTGRGTARRGNKALAAFVIFNEGFGVIGEFKFMTE